MNALVKEEFEIPEAYARHLREIACTRDVSESALIVEALEMLFEDFDIEQEIKADWDTLRELEAELGPAKAQPVATRIDPSEVVSIIAVPIDQSTIRRRPRRKRDIH
jgi:hypothetical protein